jgi:hypothetical protein
MWRSAGSRVSVVGMLLGFGVAAAGAANIPIVPSKLIVVDTLTLAGKAKTVFVAKDVAVTKGSGTDTSTIGVQFDVVYGNGNTAGAFTVWPKQVTGWIVNNPQVAKYANRAAPDGPTGVRVAVIKPTKLLKLVGKSLGTTPLDILQAGDPMGSVFVAYCVQNDAERNCHCAELTSCVHKPIAGGTGAKLLCKGGVGDPTCKAACMGLVDLGSSVLDTCTKLEWEKKDTALGSGVDPGNLRDVDNAYAWSGECATSGALCQPNAAAAAACMAHTPDGAGCAECGVGEGTCEPQGVAVTTVWDWLVQLNASSFAGHDDWRLPTSAGLDFEDPFDPAPREPAELESIVDPTQGICGGGAGPCIDPIFGPTGLSYWSATTPKERLDAWMQASELTLKVPKSGVAGVRAVRLAP